MAKISRNQPCPCGSGKKYKKCCLQKDEAKRLETKMANDVPKVEPNRSSNEQLSPGMLIEDELDLLSNSVVDLINEGQFDKAEEKCSELLRNYPDVVDGFDRYAMLYEARGEKQKAAEFYKKAADFMKARPGYDRELIDEALSKVSKLSKK